MQRDFAAELGPHRLRYFLRLDEVPGHPYVSSVQVVPQPDGEHGGGTSLGPTSPGLNPVLYDIRLRILGGYIQALRRISVQRQPGVQVGSVADNLQRLRAHVGFFRGYYTVPLNRGAVEGAVGDVVVAAQRLAVDVINPRLLSQVHRKISDLRLIQLRYKRLQEGATRERIRP